jgi:hypothetical protein
MTRAKRLLAVDPPLLAHFTTEVRKSRAANSSGGASRIDDADATPEKKAGLWKRLLGG